MRRESIAEFTAKLAPCIVAMEACCGAHHLARGLKSQGHDVRLMSPEYVRPYVKAQKNDDRDAEAIAEAAARPTMRFVEVKSEEQLDMQTLHRARDRLVGERMALINQIRAILWERGIVLPQGRRPLERELARRLDEGLALGERILVLIEEMRAEWRSLDERIAAFDAEFAAQAKQDSRVRRLLSVPGIGVMNATALVAAVGNGDAFKRGRDLARAHTNTVVVAPFVDHGLQIQVSRFRTLGPFLFHLEQDRRKLMNSRHRCELRNLLKDRVTVDRLRCQTAARQIMTKRLYHRVEIFHAS